MRITFVVLCLLSVHLFGGNEEMGHYIGFIIGKKFQDSKISLNDIIAGIENVKKHKKARFNIEDCRKQLAHLHEKQFQEKSLQNLKNSEAFLAKIKKEPGVQEIIPGKLFSKKQYQGASDKEIGDTGIFHLICRTFDDQILHDTRKMNQPFKQDLDEAIPGFAEGVKGMKINERRVLFIHPDLAYQDTGWIDPNVALVLDVELVSLPSSENPYE